MTGRRSDPVEAVIAEALERAGVRFVGEDHPLNRARLDFYLPDEDIHIECKRFATERTNQQLARAPQVIVIQGLEAAQWFAKQLSGTSE